MSYAVGSLVAAREREWVVLPGSDDDLLVVRPLGGTEDEVTGIYLPLEEVRPATFEKPDPARLGDYRSGRLLRDAVRLGFRSSAGPFRSFAQLAVEPRPYQLVPLLLALKLEPVRLLIADDVGIGKTVEAALVARELLDRGEIRRLAVLCPPHLAEQWQAELRAKFHLDAALVLAGTATRLERDCAPGESLFERHPCVVVSTDFIKSDRRRAEFLRTCPACVIVDEAHTCAAGAGRGRHQRHELVQRLAARPDRHLLLVTATPHSGNEAAFRSLLALLDPAFADLPDDLTGRQHEAQRRRLAAHLVQRRRADIRHYLRADTPFPAREEREVTYRLSPEYRRLFDRVLRYAREIVRDTTGGEQRRRVRWWSALALLRSLGSSPDAAAATLRVRAAGADAATAEEADDLGRRTVFDLEDDAADEQPDVVPGSDPDESGAAGATSRRRLLELAREAAALAGERDQKLLGMVKELKALLADGYRPLVFCRFIPTAEYLAAELRARLPKTVEVVAVTGTLPPAERETRVAQLVAAPARVLVCTDCLSEGINLQEGFDAVVHYDLSWNPTRHEQREGRVDRFGQPRPTVRTLTYYGLDNPIDGIVLDVLLRKHRAIRTSLGVSVPVPVDTNQVVEAIFEGLLLREQAGTPAAQLLPGFEQYFAPQKERLFQEWDDVTARERRSRTLFAQDTIEVDEVARELAAVREAIGVGADVADFVRRACAAHGGVVTARPDGGVAVDLREAPRALRDALGVDRFTGRFDPAAADGAPYLDRTHPLVEALAAYVLDAALDPLGEGAARRAGVLRTGRVRQRTTLLLLRCRYHLVTRRGGDERVLLAEDCLLAGFTGSPANAAWLDPAEAEALLDATPEGNIHPAQAANFVQRVVADFAALAPALDARAAERGRALAAAHARVRQAARLAGTTYRVEPHLPPDVLGVYVLLPAGDDRR
ncbi:MAG TPA: helicase-related protein [Thermomicrobiales bacterium]|nr:helicase-related protein [Thermomicrobiales bacterium]